MARLKLLRNIFVFRGLRTSFKLAILGIVYLVLYHRNMRLIFLMGILALLLGFYFNLMGIELAILCITISTVFMAEMFNTAIELVLDMFTDKYNTKIKLVKDIAAGVVLTTSLSALAIGYLIFVKKIFR